VGTLLGIACATLVTIVAFLYGGTGWTIPLAVGLSLFVTVQLASLTGVLIPLTAKRLGIDPAVAAGPLVTTSNDALAILIYFGLATFLLGVFG
jgi:magnesium transporter